MINIKIWSQNILFIGLQVNLEFFYYSKEGVRIEHQCDVMCPSLLIHLGSQHLFVFSHPPFPPFPLVKVDGGRQRCRRLQFLTPKMNSLTNAFTHWTYWLQILSELCFQRVALSGNYIIVATVRPRDTWPQAARTLQVHVFELGPKIFELNEFMQ